MSKTVFINHAHSEESGKLVERLAASLTGLGHQVLLGSNNKPTSLDVTKQQMAREMAGADTIILVVDKLNSLRLLGINEEKIDESVKIARLQGMLIYDLLYDVKTATRLLPIIFTGVGTPEHLPIGFKSSRYIELSTSLKEDEMKKLHDRIQGVNPCPPPALGRELV
jgi:hypothetical protein